MKQFRCCFSISYIDGTRKEFNKIIYAKDKAELDRNALKILLHDVIEEESGLLDNADTVFYFDKMSKEVN